MTPEPRGHAGPLIASDERLVITVADWLVIEKRLRAVEAFILSCGGTLEGADPPDGG